MAFSTGSGRVPGAAVTWARSVQRLTATSCTPSTPRMAFSTRPTQEAQLIPAMGIAKVCDDGAVEDASLSVTGLFLESPDGPFHKGSHRGKVKGVKPALRPGKGCLGKSA